MVAVAKELIPSLRVTFTFLVLFWIAAVSLEGVPGQASAQWSNPISSERFDGAVCTKNSRTCVFRYRGRCLSHRPVKKKVCCEGTTEVKTTVGTICIKIPKLPPLPDNDDDAQCQGEGTVQPSTECGVTCRCLSGRVSCCRERKEVHDMTEEERRIFFTAYKSAYKNDLPFMHLLFIHDRKFAEVQSREQVLPWHRWFILSVENYLRSTTSDSCSLTMPYWDWTRNNDKPWQEPVWTADYFGGDGAASDQCAETGPFRKGTFDVMSGGCLKRQFSGTTPSPSAVDTLLQTPVADFEGTFVDSLKALANSVRDDIGGTMTYDPVSPGAKANEAPEFFLVYGNADKIWSDWQKTSTSHRDEYYGELTASLSGAGNSARDLVDNDNLPGDVCVRYMPRQN